jgi:hypothetical protein
VLDVIQRTLSGWAIKFISYYPPNDLSHRFQASKVDAVLPDLSHLDANLLTSAQRHDDRGMLAIDFD